MLTPLLFSTAMICAEPPSDYVAAHNQLKAAAKEANRNVSQETARELKQAIEHISEFPDDLAADPDGPKQRRIALLSLSRLYINIDDMDQAAAAMDQAIFAAGDDPLPVDRFGPDTEKLYKERRAELDERGRAEVEIFCSVPCNVYIDGNLVHGREFELYLGDHVIQMTSDLYPPVSTEFDLDPGGFMVDYDGLLPDEPDEQPSVPARDHVTDARSAGADETRKSARNGQVDSHGAHTRTAVVWGKAEGPVPRWKLIAVAVSGGVTLATLGAGIGLSVTIGPNGSWRRDLLAAVDASLTDGKPANDVDPIGNNSNYTYCEYANIRPDVSQPNVVLNKAVSDICQHGDRLEYRAKAMYIWAGASALTTVIFAMLINTRRVPVVNDALAVHQPNLTIAPTPDGGLMAAGSFRF